MMNCFWAWQTHKFSINSAVLLSEFFQHFFSGLTLDSSGKTENQLLHIFSFSCAFVMILCLISCAVIHLFLIFAAGNENLKFGFLFTVTLQKCHGLLCYCLFFEQISTEEKYTEYSYPAYTWVRVPNNTDECHYLTTVVVHFVCNLRSFTISS